jgi:hypothetical protein
MYLGVVFILPLNFFDTFVEAQLNLDISAAADHFFMKVSFFGFGGSFQMDLKKRNQFQSGWSF